MSINQNVTTRKLRWNNFNLSHTHDTTGRFGNLIPVQCMEVVPGDLIRQKIEYNIRLSPLSAPAMVRLNAHFHSFYIPYRILTPRTGQESTWEKFIMNVGNPMMVDGRMQLPELPYFYADDTYSNDDLGDTSSIPGQKFMKGSLWDYFKLPVIPSSDIDINLSYQRRISALPHLAYLKTFNDWYRRDQIESEILFPLNLEGIRMDNVAETDYSEPEDSVNAVWNGIDQFVNELMTIRSRNYERDYFTSGLPEPQFGDDVTIGDRFDIIAASNASVAFTGFQAGATTLSNPLLDRGPALNYYHPNNSSLSTSLATYLPNLAVDAGVLTGGSSDHWTLGADGESRGSFNVEDIEGLQSSYSFSINELRMAMQLQGLREQINRGGTRYIEIMKSVYGVSVSDLRLQRVQYLGGVKAPLTIGAVIQTSESQNTPQGTLTGQGGAVGGNVLFHTKQIFEEHGFVLTLMSITPRTSYYGGVPRMFRKFDPLDYYNPMFDHLGEQETMATELFDSIQDGDLGEVNEGVFAYNPRYQDYKSAISTVTGEFRDTLSNWVLSRSFPQSPTLSPDFIHADSEDFDRLFKFENVENTSNEHFQVQLYFDISAKRPMSKYSTPFTFF